MCYFLVAGGPGPLLSVMAMPHKNPKRGQRAITHNNKKVKPKINKRKRNKGTPDNDSNKYRKAMGI